MGKLFNACRLIYLAYFSKPAGDRLIYRAIRRGKVKSVLELGLGCGLRTGRMFETVRRSQGSTGLCYTGIDLFELSPAADRARLSLKAAHCKLKPSGARVRLVPGDPFTALARAANEIGACDLIVIAADQAGESLNRAWFYIPRLLHPTTQVFVERPGDGSMPNFESLSHDEVRRLAHASAPRRTAA